MQHAGIGPKQLANPEELLSLRAVVETLEIGAQESNDPAFGLSFGEAAPWSEFGPLGDVIFNSPTLHAALTNACRYFGVQQNAARPSLDIEGGSASLLYTLDTPELTQHAQHSEQILTIATRVCRTGTGNLGWAPREVHFKHSRPDSTTKAREFFRCTILYDQPVDAIVMDVDDLDVPMQTADAIVLPTVLRDVEERLSRLPFAFDVADQVARVVLSSLSTGNVTIEHVATVLESSPRTIQRRLYERGLSFNDVVANTRLELARRYLTDSALTLTDVAFLLGYSDLSAFSRAFRRWTGQTAITFRRSQIAIRSTLEGLTHQERETEAGRPARTRRTRGAL